MDANTDVFRESLSWHGFGRCGIFFSPIVLYLPFALNGGMKGNTFSLSYKEIAIMKAQRHLAPYKAGEGRGQLQVQVS